MGGTRFISGTGGAGGAGEGLSLALPLAAASALDFLFESLFDFSGDFR